MKRTLEIIDGASIIKEDPIVLCPVINKHRIIGFFIVTKWGLEENIDELKT